jgi:hypothetical protein
MIFLSKATVGDPGGSARIENGKTKIGGNRNLARGFGKDSRTNGDVSHGGNFLSGEDEEFERAGAFNFL